MPSNCTTHETAVAPAKEMRDIREESLPVDGVRVKARAFEDHGYSLKHLLTHIILQAAFKKQGLETYEHICILLQFVL